MIFFVFTFFSEGEAALLFATHSDVRLLYLTSRVYDKVASNVNLSSCVSFDGVYAFWATYADGEEAIYRATEIGTEMQMVLTAGNQFFHLDLHVLNSLSLMHIRLLSQQCWRILFWYLLVSNKLG